MYASLLKNHGIAGAACLCLMIGSAVSAQDAQAPRPVIHVHTVKELYAAVNNPANHDATVRLAPGTYVLSTLYPQGANRPNLGSLRMPPGMSLVGSEKRVDTNGDGVPDPVSDATPDDFTVPGTETIIDGSALVLPPDVRTDCAGETFFAPNPVIHVGVGNTVANLTLIAGSNIAISEPTNDPVDPNGNLSMEVTNTVLLSTTLAMGFSNCECAARRARSVLTFTHNVVHDVSFIGVLIQNFLTGDARIGASDGPTVSATLTSNLFYNNRIAVIANGGNKGTDGGSVTLYMSGNVFRNNGGNFQGAAGAPGLATPAVGNRLTVWSDHDTFGESLAGVSLTAGQGTVSDDPKRSDLEAEFLHSHFIRDSVDTPAEVSIVGGGGSHNRAEVLIRDATVKTSAGARTQGGLLIQNQAAPGIGTSKARLEGSQAEFVQSNQGLPAPAARFFLQQ
jgi:hypothetical protein